MKKLLSALLLLALCLGVCACNSQTPTEAPTSAPTQTAAPTDTQAPTEKPTSTPTEPPRIEVESTEPVYDDGEITLADRVYKLSDVTDKLKLQGRAQVLENGIACDFTASGIAFRAYIKEDLTFSVSCTKTTYFTVLKDGVRVGTRYTAGSDGVTDITVRGIGDGGVAPHEIEILKQTEPQWSTSVLEEMSFHGQLVTKPADKKYFIEFIGDSITCGYGNLWTPDSFAASSASGNADYEDGTAAYAYLCAQSLEADCSVISCSGIGVDKGWTSFSMGDLYPKASYFRDKDTDYDFARTPDLVVINLGTNDKSRGSTEADFKAKARALIELIRTKYGEDTSIVWAYGMMGDARCAWSKDVISSLGGEAAGLYTVELTQNSDGGNGHPSRTAQRYAAAELCDFLYSKNICR